MKKIALIALLLLTAMAPSVQAKDGYHIKLKLTDVKDTMVYLAHYYAKPLPTLYKSDSARFNSKGIAVFNSDSTVLGGIYILMLSDHKTYIEFLLDNGDNMEIDMAAKHLPDGVTFKHSPQNVQFQDYTKFIKTFGEKQQSIMSELSVAHTRADTLAIDKKLSEHSEELPEYRRKYVKEHPHTLLASIFNALELPEVPKGKHYLPDGTVDTTFAYEYYKAHFWDHFNFQDDRLINTPIYDAKLSKYINTEVYPYPDSIEHEADVLLAKTRGTKELFKYTLSWFANFAQESKIMGMDEVFVYLVENYYMKGDATWLDPETLNKFIERASKIKPNVIGNIAPELKMKGVDDKEYALSDVKAKYTLLVFWSPTCGHCEIEIPKLDSEYNALLKKEGVKVFAVKTEGTEKQWTDFIKKHHIGDWINVYDPDHSTGYVNKYDVYSTPTIYLLDEKKIIRGKRLDHTTIPEVIKMLKRKEKEKNKS